MKTHPAKNHKTAPRKYIQDLRRLKISKDNDDGFPDGPFLEYPLPQYARTAQIVACQAGLRVTLRKITMPNGSNVWRVWSLGEVKPKGAK